LRQEPDVDGTEIPILTGKTLALYRFLYKSGKPLGIREIQRGIKFSSPSVAQYHLRKLLLARLVREEQGGYVVDKVIFENMIRIRRSLIPVQFAYATFFAAMTCALVILFRPANLVTPLFIFALVQGISAAGIFTAEALRSNRNP
jgi:predicted DNA-binding transcriptional regulator